MKNYKAVFANSATIQGTMTKNVYPSKIQCFNREQDRFWFTVKTKKGKHTFNFPCVLICEGARSEHFKQYAYEGMPITVTGELSIDKKMKATDPKDTETILYVERFALGYPVEDEER